MTRWEWPIDILRLAVLRWRMLRSRALPTFGMASLGWLDRRALALQRRRYTR
jgi:hypothetical protein